MKSKKKFAGAKSWIKRHQGDKYVRKAHQEGFRSRSRFKLEEIQKSSDLFKRGMTVLDLGSSPGGWSQYAAEIVRPHGHVIACDILPMQPISDVRFLQGDFREESVFEALVALTGEKKFNIVMSDMSPNISGISATDIPRSVHLVQLAFEMCQKTLISGGSFIAKVFQGDNTDDHLKKIRSLFTEVRIRKPDASRSRSREVYIVAVGYKKS